MVSVDEESRTGRLLEVSGIVQAVGFRPFVYRLAAEMGLDGRVRNAAGRVEIEVAGDPPELDRFAARLAAEAPPRARVERVAVSPLEVGRMPPRGGGFVILESVEAENTERLFPPDIATCDDCLRELFDPRDRRFRYPFINCTNCGPRATIIEDLPYDRRKTSMRDFPLCSECEGEYRDPADRRFHAEPVACHVCGPQLRYWRTGEPAPRLDREAALEAAIADLRAGRIVAVKGLGGYHIACDAGNEAAVARLRDRKGRWAKPFAVMVADVEAAGRVAELDADEAELLTSPARPIVLLRRRDESAIVPGVTNGDLRVGLFLPYTPLHHLLMRGFDGPLVLTSGNLSDEPLVTDDEEAIARLGGIADAFLQHDRRIRARYDDSVTRVVDGRESIVRRGRGYAPDPLDLPFAVPAPLLAVGAELKHTFTLASARRAYVAPHTGDLEDLATHRAFDENLAHLERLLALEPEWVAHDLHPAYISTQFAVARFPAQARIGVQHHHAHIASCAAEHGLTAPVIGVAYDGLGLGDDGTFWGGEVLVADLMGYRRVARFARAPLPGGAMAVKKPYRMALGYLYGLEHDDADMRVPAPHLSDLATPFLERLDPREVAVMRVQIERGLNAPLASSAGRLFDAVSSLLGIRDVAEYEAQAAIELETAAGRNSVAEPDPDAAVGVGPGTPLPYRLVVRDGLLVYDPAVTLRALLEGIAAGIRPGVLAARFQQTVLAVSRELCQHVRNETGIGTVCLSGGVFQNHWLASSLLAQLVGDGFDVFINRQVPVNDGGISYGQAAVAAARLAGA
jgi:hydrogenase maturation protein HypF